MSEFIQSGDKGRWLVIGGGPCGIASVGRLIDKGFECIWADDNQFQVGRMGEFYEEVPANTPNGDLLRAMRMCESFRFEEYQQKRRNRNEEVMADLDSKTCWKLKYLVDALHDATEALLSTKLVTAIHGKVVSIDYDEHTRIWKYTIHLPNNNQLLTGEANAVIMNCGSRPKHLPGFLLPERNNPPLPVVLSSKKSICFHSIDTMMNPVYCTNMVTTQLCPIEDQRWIIIGDSHSGILLVKSLIEAGVKDIINIHRSPLRFMTTTNTEKPKYQGIGLKGPVGEWAKTMLPHPAIQRIQYDPSQSWDSLLSNYALDTLHETRSIKHIRTHCIGAHGFERMQSITIHALEQEVTKAMLDHYDRITGEIMLPMSTSVVSVHRIGLFGGGIAFPQDYVHDDGEREPWVGFRRTIEQTDLMIAAFQSTTPALKNIC